MTTLRSVSLATLLVVGGALLIAAASTVSPHVLARGSTQSGLRIAYLDLETVFERSQAKVDKQKELQRYIDERRAELQEIEKEMTAIKSRLEMLKEGSGEYTRMQEQFLNKKTRLQLKSQEAETALEKRWSEFRESHIEQIRDVVQSFADSQSLDLVLQKRMPREKGLPDWPFVFWARNDLDITEAVIALLNGD